MAHRDKKGRAKRESPPGGATGGAGLPPESPGSDRGGIVGSGKVRRHEAETRAADAPAGAHAISGSWKMNKYNNVSDEGLTITYKLDGDTLHMTSPTGQSFDAKLDGTATPIKGDIGGTTASVKKTGDKTYEETDTRDGKVVSVTATTVDGDTLHIVSQNKLDGSSMKYDAKRS